jgi:hypothetical protein
MTEMEWMRLKSGNLTPRFQQKDEHSAESDVGGDWRTGTQSAIRMHDSPLGLGRK